MPIKNGKQTRKTTPRMIRFPIDLDLWLQKQAKKQGIISGAELVRQITHEYRQRVESQSASA